MARVLIAILAWIAMAVGSTAVAQQALPEFRYIATRDMDFYGADLDSLFGTDLQSCVRACSANPQCGAFTFNSRSNACFPKRGVQDMTPFVGAVSARRSSQSVGRRQSWGAWRTARRSRRWRRARSQPVP